MNESGAGGKLVVYSAAAVQRPLALIEYGTYGSSIITLMEVLSVVICLPN